eukprot:CAMPEP_0177418580 /NCGR_PEP_ID=MMETSP0368-20130122/69256_1 /TAXON_ID=447022 ORGANISM="Scrippsiella hangoei-like, Strain SHHI-4" /NCGR_SAMPLE_ID=MMETSP0368 /ASSEMBLY_ACC=CAM_ASM_000363 /LENGTH=206 /DNA_ID=CAMNT_0018888231 /DNA_START=112 /DNA_END=731 /DNA_ORIENTATION=+
MQGVNRVLEVAVQQVAMGKRFDQAFLKPLLRMPHHGPVDIMSAGMPIKKSVNLTLDQMYALIFLSVVLLVLLEVLEQMLHLCASMPSFPDPLEQQHGNDAAETIRSAEDPCCENICTCGIACIKHAQHPRVDAVPGVDAHNEPAPQEYHQVDYLQPEQRFATSQGHGVEDVLQWDNCGQRGSTADEQHNQQSHIWVVAVAHNSGDC